MATNQTNNGLFAPPSSDELVQVTKPTSQRDLLAPPTEEELLAPPSEEELAASTASPAAPPTGRISEGELQTIAKEFGVSADELAKSAPFLGLDVEGRDNSSFWNAAGFLGESVAFGLPQKYFIEKQAKPEERAALQALRDVADKRKSGLRTAAEIGTGIATGVGVARGIAAGAANAGKIGAGVARAIDIASPALSGAVVGAAHSAEGEELKGAATGAAFGVGGQMLFKGIGAAIGKFKAGRAEQLAAKAADGLDLDRRATEAVASKLPALREQFQSALTKEADALEGAELEDLQGFARYLGIGKQSAAKTQEALKSRIAQEGPEFVAKQFENFQQTKEAFTLLGKDIDETASQVWKEKTNIIQRAKDALRDGLFTMRRIDDAIGTNLETDVAMKLGDANNRYTVTLGAVSKDIRAVQKAMKQGGIDDGTLYRALDTGDTGGLTPQQMPAFEAAKQAWENMRTLANDLGVPIQQLTGGTYVKHAVVDPVKYVSLMDRRAEELSKKLGVDILNTGLDGQDELFERLQKMDADFVKGVRLFVDRPEAITDGRSFTAALREALGSREIGESFNTKAAAAQMREGGIPEFLREKDVAALMGRWAQNTFKHAFYREGLADLKKARDLAIAAGDSSAAVYLNNLAADIAGVRGNTLHGAAKRSITNFQIKHQKAADRAVSSGSKHFHQFMADAPNFMPNLFQQVYPNFLGLKPQAIIMNATQPWMMTVPELGHGYGSSKVLKAYASAAGIAARGRAITLTPEMAKMLGKQAGDVVHTHNPALVLYNQGQLPKQWSTELKDALKTGIAKSAPVRMAGSALDRITDASMKVFEMSEAMNRIVASEVASDVARDLLGKGSPKAQAAAQRFMQNAGSAYRRAAEAAIKQGDDAALEKLTRQYLTSKTIFNYNRATMSEAGRFLGPALSVFTKWPYAIAGDVSEQYRRHGAVGGSAEVGRKYLAPLAAVWAVDRLVLPDPEESPTTRFLLGRGGLTSSAPIGTVGSLLTGKVAQPPVLATFGKLADGVMKGDPLGGTWRAFNGALESFAPGAVLLRTYTDVRDLRNEERSEGTFLNKLAPDVGLDDRVKDAKDSVAEKLDSMSLGR